MGLTFYISNKLQEVMSMLLIHKQSLMSKDDLSGLSIDQRVVCCLSLSDRIKIVFDMRRENGIKTREINGAEHSRRTEVNTETSHWLGFTFTHLKRWVDLLSPSKPPCQSLHMKNWFIEGHWF